MLHSGLCGIVRNFSRIYLGRIVEYKTCTSNRTMKWAAAMAAAAFLAGTLTAAVPASAKSDEVGVYLDLKKTQKFFDLNKKPISIVADDADAGERTLLGETASGAPAKIVIQNAPPMTAAPVLPSPSLEPERQLPVPPAVEVTSLSDKELEFNTSTMKPVSAWAVTPTTASLAWDIDKSDVTSVVQIDGRPAQSVSGGRYSMPGLLPSTKYVITVTTPVLTAEGEVESKKTFSLQTLAASGLPVTPQTFQTYGTAFQYKTFIPAAQVDASMCNWGDTSFTFGGDNRGFRSPPINAPFDAPDYRTMMWANVNWQNPDGEKLVLAKNVGQSITYRYGQVYATSYASTSSMLFQEGQSAGSYAQVRFKHDASNPHCKIFDANYGGAISYSVMVRFYRSGLVEVVGNRQQAPAHEGWARFNTTAGTEQWLNVFQLNHLDFKCLLGLCGTQTINYARSY